MATTYFVDVAGLKHYDGAQIEPIRTRVTTVEGYFTDGAANNALTLEGHAASYFATADALESAVSSMTWQSPVADAAALKAVTAPSDTDTRALLDTNAIYQFNASSTAEESAPDVYKPDDGTAGAWIMLSHMVYSNATQEADGLMSAADKTKLDALPTNAELATQLAAKAAVADVEALETKVTSLETASGNYVEKEDGKSLISTDDITKLEGLADIKTIGTNLTLDESGVLSATYEYALTAATADTLGGVKIGDNIDVTDDGTISVTFPDIQAATDAQIDAAFA